MDLILISLEACLFIVILYTILLTHKPQILSILFLLASAAYYFVKMDIVLYACYADLGITILLTIFFTLKKINKQSIITKKTIEQLRNDTNDFFITLNKNYKITTYSKSFTAFYNPKDKALKKKNGFDILFEALHTTKLNDAPVVPATQSIFKEHLHELTSNDKKYHFRIEANPYEGQKPITYDAYIDVIYKRDKILAYNVYFYEDKSLVAKEIAALYDEMKEKYITSKNILQYYMSLTEGIVFYYDPEQETYIASQSYLNYTNRTNHYISVEEFFSSIHPDDVDSYQLQGQKINNYCPIRIKYRLLIGDEYYQAVEDAMYLKENNSVLLSIVTIVGKVDCSNVKSFEETVQEIDDLVKVPLSDIVEDTKGLLHEVLKDE